MKISELLRERGTILRSTIEHVYLDKILYSFFLNLKNDKFPPLKREVNNTIVLSGFGL